MAMLAGIGTDIHEVARMARELRQHDGGLRDVVFTPAEIARCNAATDPAGAFAAVFATKEAVLKALGTGWSGGLSWLDINVDRSARAPVRVTLSGTARTVADRLGVSNVHASVSQNPRFAMATVLLEA